MLHAFTVDVEDYFHVSGFERDIPRSAWPDFASRVVANTQRMLDLLDACKVQATFFVLGWVADRYPALVREIQRRGHELGSHSFWHRLVYDLSPAAFREDLRASLAAIEDASGAKVTSFRAPSFSITSKSLWALEILVEEGIATDSSIFPSRHDRYGIPGAPLGIHRLATPSGGLDEFPPSVARLAGIRIPVGGGGYFRLYPWAVSRRLLAGVEREKRPLMFYVHPWEIDPDQPRLQVATAQTRFRHYVNLNTTRSKLQRLLETFTFGTMSAALAQVPSGDELPGALSPSTDNPTLVDASA